MFEIKCATESEYGEICSFYDAMIEQLAESLHSPGWKRDRYPSDDYLLQAVRRQELYVGRLEDGSIAAAMVLNHDCNEGYAGVPWSVEAKPEEATVIHTLGVLPACGGKGLGKRMVNEAIAIARQNSQKVVRLDAVSGNVPAERLYSGSGFQYVTTVHMYYADTGWADFRLYEYPL